MDWRPMGSFSDFPFVEELCSDLLQSKYCPISLEANHLFNASFPIHIKSSLISDQFFRKLFIGYVGETLENGNPSNCLLIEQQTSALKSKQCSPSSGINTTSSVTVIAPLVNNPCPSTNPGAKSVPTSLDVMGWAFRTACVAYCGCLLEEMAGAVQKRRNLLCSNPTRISDSFAPLGVVHSQAHLVEQAMGIFQ
ncbi:hypothetical protein CDAR_426001 [Caerostris darwini]|uniref:Uncharacterized protein n=1 Tax=Caerostris darwini TaxID=1538125 RepID=A0AAV4T5K9_9ARAC|nr:hypothetical protein CDAR_426001 [Caerostris darwini]